MQNINFLIDDILNNAERIESNKVKDFFITMKVTEEVLSRHTWLRDIVKDKPNSVLMLPIDFDEIENEIINFKSGLKLKYTYVYPQTEAIKELVKGDETLSLFVEQYLPVSIVRYVLL